MRWPSDTTRTWSRWSTGWPGCESTTSAQGPRPHLWRSGRAPARARRACSGPDRRRGERSARRIGRHRGERGPRVRGRGGGAPGDAAEAADLATRATTDARMLGMVPWAARAEQVAANLHPTGTAPGPLTAREEEVAELVSRGLTNRAIAEALVVSERTAQNHVQHILTKLGFTARSQVAAWVVSRR